MLDVCLKILFFILSKNKKMSSAREGTYKCFYFCLRFYSTFKNDYYLNGAFVKKKGAEGTFICGGCLFDLSYLVSEDDSHFFDGVKKMLIQYFVPNSASNKVSLLYEILNRRHLFDVGVRVYF